MWPLNPVLYFFIKENDGMLNGKMLFLEAKMKGKLNLKRILVLSLAFTLFFFQTSYTQ